jgi:hypothetical protein
MAQWARADFRWRGVKPFRSRPTHLSIGGKIKRRSYEIVKSDTGSTTQRKRQRAVSQPAFSNLEIIAFVHPGCRPVLVGYCDRRHCGCCSVVSRDPASREHSYLAMAWRVFRRYIGRSIHGLAQTTNRKRPLATSQCHARYIDEVGTV